MSLPPTEQIGYLQKEKTIPDSHIVFCKRRCLIVGDSLSFKVDRMQHNKKVFVRAFKGAETMEWLEIDFSRLLDSLEKKKYYTDIRLHVDGKNPHFEIELDMPIEQTDLLLSSPPKYKKKIQNINIIGIKSFKTILVNLIDFIHCTFLSDIYKGDTKYSIEKVPNEFTYKLHIMSLTDIISLKKVLL